MNDNDQPTEASPKTDAAQAYAERIEAKRERYAALAVKKEGEAQAAYAASRRISDMIPMGQPILAGHHSEGRHRRDLDRIGDKMRQSIELGKVAEHYADKAENYGKHGISSDDPAAVAKLQAELVRLEARQARMRSVSKAIRAKDPGAALAALGFDSDQTAALLRPNYMGKPGGVEPWQLSNNSANMRRIRQRIADLSAKASRPAAPEREVAGVRIVDNVEANRLQLLFPGKPDEATRARLKSYGFRWSPTVGAWQAFRSSRATWAADQVLKGATT